MAQDADRPAVVPIHPRPRALREVVRSVASILEWHALRTYCLAQLDWRASRHTGRAEQFGQAIPWWSYGCTHFVGQVVAPGARVLEFGAGASTEWWLERGNEVTALESSAEWVDIVRSRCSAHADRLEIVQVDFGLLDASSVIRNGAKFDVVVIDNEGPRSGLVEIALAALDDDGVLIFDNADRAAYRDALDALENHGCHRLDFFGLGPINSYAWLTSIFTRRDFVRLQGTPSPFATVTY
jgi:precorrin-6B methylase 2